MVSSSNLAIKHPYGSL
jgi:hypothetical protein